MPLTLSSYVRTPHGGRASRSDRWLRAVLTPRIVTPLSCRSSDRSVSTDSTRAAGMRSPPRIWPPDALRGDGEGLRPPILGDQHDARRRRAASARDASSMSC